MSLYLYYRCSKCNWSQLSRDQGLAKENDQLCFNLSPSYSKWVNPVKRIVVKIGRGILFEQPEEQNSGNPSEKNSMSFLTFYHFAFPFFTEFEILATEMPPISFSKKWMKFSSDCFLLREFEIRNHEINLRIYFLTYQMVALKVSA